MRPCLTVMGINRQSNDQPSILHLQVCRQERKSHPWNRDGSWLYDVSGMADLLIHTSLRGPPAA